MKYQDIKDFHERCDAHPDHQDRIIGHADIQLRLHEEIAELRHFIEWHIMPKQKLDFSKVRTITVDGKCMGWDGNEINTAA